MTKAEVKDQPKVEAKKANVERWISRSFSEHSIIVQVDGKPAVVNFENYGVTLDMNDPEQAKISKGLEECGREGRDIFVVCDEPYADSDIGGKASMLRRLRDMEVAQLRSMLTLDEIISAGVPANTRDKEDLIAVIMQQKSIKE